MIKNDPTSVNAAKWMIFFVLLATTAVWAITLTFGFVWDDLPTIVTNPSLRHWDTLGRAFVSDFWGLHDNPVSSGYWRPLPTIVYVFVAQIFGKNAWAFHTANLAFYLAVSVSLAQLLLELGFEPLVVLFASLFFAAHPLHAETVSFVSALPDLAAAFFGLQAIRLWLLKGRRATVFGGICFALALLSKESALVFAFVLAGKI